MTQRKGAFHVSVFTGFIPRLSAAGFGSCRNLAGLIRAESYLICSMTEEEQTDNGLGGYVKDFGYSLPLLLPKLSLPRALHPFSYLVRTRRGSLPFPSTQ